MRRLRILITTWTLAQRGGSTLYTRDLALGLMASGHRPIVYSPIAGAIGDELRAATIPVVNDLGDVGEPPDLIHGNHHPELMTALLQFPGTPALHVCHAWATWDAAPPRFPRIRRFVAVDETCRDWLIGEQGIPVEQTSVHYNAVDLRRFQPRPPLPERPKRGLVFSNYASEQSYLGAVRSACEQAGLELHVVGAGAGNPCSEPEAVLGNYDLVFAKARCALEAMAVGTAVVLCDTLGTGPMVRVENWQRLRQMNFGRRSLRPPVRAQDLLAAIRQYNAADAMEVARQIRDSAGLERAVDAMVALYGAILAEHAAAPAADPLAELRAAASYLAWLTPSAKSAGELISERNQLAAELGRWRESGKVLDHPLVEQLAEARHERDQWRTALLEANRSITMRLRNGLARIPLVAPAVRFVARLGRRRAA